jgi:acyl-coenzyme A synthetase/AMP-(fatty) acid ligase
MIVLNNIVLKQVSEKCPRYPIKTCDEKRTKQAKRCLPRQACLVRPTRMPPPGPRDWIAGLNPPAIRSQPVSGRAAGPSREKPGWHWNRPEETAQAVTADGWFRTGDLARQDGNGFITLADRRKDMFISGGENVYPVEVEMVLLDHPDIADVAVIGISDERWGEVGRAFGVIKPRRLFDPSALTSHCIARIARYKVPKEFLATEALPRTASGKIQKHLLRARTEPS